MICWSYTNAAPDSFKVYQTTNVALALTNWTVLTNVSALASAGTNTWPTNSCLAYVTPGSYFFTVTASNFWGESIPAPPASTPAPVGNVTNTVIKRQ